MEEDLEARMTEQHADSGESLEDEVSHWSKKLPLEKIEELLHPGTYKELGEKIGNLLAEVHTHYTITDDGKFAKPNYVAGIIVDRLADLILPGGIEINDQTRDYVRTLLRDKGIEYDGLRRQLATQDVKAVDEFITRFREQFLNPATQSYQQMAQEALNEHYQDDKIALAEHIEGRTGEHGQFHPDKKNSYLLEDAFRLIQTYMSHEDAYEPGGQLNNENTKLSLAEVARVGKDILQSYEFAVAAEKNRPTVVAKKDHEGEAKVYEGPKPAEPHKEDKKYASGGGHGGH